MEQFTQKQRDRVAHLYQSLDYRLKVVFEEGNSRSTKPGISFE